MTKELEKVLAVISERLKYPPYSDGFFDISEKRLLDVVGDKEKLGLIIRQLGKEGVIKKYSQMYAASKPLPTYPKHMDFVSSPSETYNRLTYFFDIDLDKLNKLPQEIPAAEPLDQLPKMICGQLTISPQEAKLQYKGYIVKNIPLESNPIKFLLFLIKNKGVVKTYLEVAEELDLSCFRPNENQNNNEIVVKENVQKQKQYLKNELAANGLSEKIAQEIIDMIKSITNVGYKIEFEE